MKFTKKRITILAIIIFILLLPFLLLLNPVLEKFQERNTKMHKKLLKKKDNDENVEKEWENLKYRQKLLGNIYHYTFREASAASTYEKYLEWFHRDWETKEYARIKYKTGTIYRSLSHGSMRRKTYLNKAACHFHEILEWYDDRGPDYEKVRDESRRAINSFNLYKYISDCDGMR